MSQEFKGFVRRVFAKEGTGRNGKPYTLYSFKLATAEGQELPTWFQLGFEEPNVKADWNGEKYGNGGSYVKFTGEKNGDSAVKVDESSLKRLKNPPARKEVEAPAKKGGYGGKGGGGPKEKDSKLFGKIGGYNTEDDVRRMSYSSARGDAVAVIELLLANDALPMTTASTKAAQAKRFDEILAAVDKLTVKFFFDAATGRQLELVGDTMVKTPAAAALPDDADEGDDDVEDEDTESEDAEEDVEDEDEESEEDEVDEEDSEDEEEDDE